MVMKWFALASVSALAGLVCAAGVAGCSDTTATPGSDGGSSDGGAQGQRPPVGDDEDPPAVKCYLDDPIDLSTIPYKPARMRPKACTENVFTVISDLAAEGNGSVQYPELKEAIAANESAECADCVFGDNGDTWAPLVASGTPDDFIENFGGCYEGLSGNASCGESMQKWLGCLGKACSLCGSRDHRNECTSAVQETACKAATDAVAETCGTSNVNTYLKKCRNSEYVIQVGGTIQQLCVAGPKDAGTD